MVPLLSIMVLCFPPVIHWMYFLFFVSHLSHFSLPLFLWMSFSSTCFGLVAISHCVPICLIATSHTFSLPVTTPVSFFWVFLFFSSFTLVCFSMGSSHLLIGELWLFVCGFASLLALSDFPLFAATLAAETWNFSHYPSISFVVYTS